VSFEARIQDATEKTLLWESVTVGVQALPASPNKSRQCAALAGEDCCTALLPGEMTVAISRGRSGETGLSQSKREAMLRKHFDGNLREGAQSRIGCHEPLATMLNRSGQVQGIHRTVAVSGADRRGPVANRRSDRHNFHVFGPEVTVESSQCHCIAQSQRAHSAFHPHQVADDQPFALGQQGLDAARAAGPKPGGRSMRYTTMFVSRNTGTAFTRYWPVVGALVPQSRASADRPRRAWR